MYLISNLTGQLTITACVSTTKCQKDPPTGGLINDTYILDNYTVHNSYIGGHSGGVHIRIL